MEFGVYQPLYALITCGLAFVSANSESETAVEIQRKIGDQQGEPAHSSIFIGHIVAGQVAYLLLTAIIGR